MLKKALFVTTALVVGAAASFAEQGPETEPDANAQFVSWYSASAAAGANDHLAPRDGGSLLYEQSASSGFSSYAVSATNYSSSSGNCCFGNIAADDFIIPGSGTHRISAVYAAGLVSGSVPQTWTVTFYDKLRYNAKSGTTAAVLKAICNSKSFSESGGNVLVDVRSCNLGKFRSNHDYALSIYADVGPYYGYGGSWAWQTNRNQIKRQAFYFTYTGVSGSCTTEFMPIKICFPGSGYGPDLAFAIYGE